MKIVIVAALLLLCVPAKAQNGPLDLVTNGVRSVVTDIKTNTKFRIDSTVPLTEFDWQRGEWSAGTAVPFFQLGSYAYTGFAYTKSLTTNRIGKAGIIQGVRLNGITRPAAVYALNKVLLGTLDQHTMLDFLAKSTSAGITAGHDFNSLDRKKVAFNSFTAFFGLEMAFGPDPSAVTTAETKKVRSMYFR